MGLWKNLEMTVVKSARSKSFRTKREPKVWFQSRRLKRSLAGRHLCERPTKKSNNVIDLRACAVKENSTLKVFKVLSTSEGLHTMEAPWKPLGSPAFFACKRLEAPKPPILREILLSFFQKPLNHNLCVFHCTQWRNQYKIDNIT